MDPNRPTLCRQDRLFDRFVPRIKSSVELMTMDSHMPSQDNIQEHLKTAQEDCQRLREENARLRAMLGIDHSDTNEPVSQAAPVPKLSSAGTSGVSTPEKRSRSFEIYFVGAKTFSPLDGKGGVANLVIHQLASWTGVPSMHRDRKSERRLPAKPGCSSH